MRSIVLNDSKSRKEKSRRRRRKRKRKKKKKKRREKSRGREKLTILLRSIRWTLEVKVLHHVPEHLIIVFIYLIAPLDIIPYPDHFNTLSLLLCAYSLNFDLHSCPPFIIIVHTGFLFMVQVCTYLLSITTIITIIMYLWVSTNIKKIFHHLRISYDQIR